MRPRTLAEAYDRIWRGEDQALAVAEFLDHFYSASREGREAALTPEPAALSEKLDALAGAVAHYLAHRSGLEPPRWAWSPSRILRSPWFTVDGADDAVKAYLAHCSPAEFKSRNIFTEERPLRRASQSFIPDHVPSNPGM